MGNAPRVDISVIHDILRCGRVPVIAPISLGDDFKPINVNADEAAHAIASTLAVDSLDFISDIPGVCCAQDNVMAQIDTDEIPKLIKNNVVTGGMIPKLQAALSAIKAGVNRVRIGNLSAMKSNTATEVRATT